MKSTILLCLLAIFSVKIIAQEKPPQPVMPELLAAFPAVRDFTTNGKEAYFTAQSHGGEISAIFCAKKVGKKWQKPSLVSFSGKNQDLEPFLSPDGLRLFFASDRQLSETVAGAKDFDIWYVERAKPDAPWGAPVNLGSPVNSAANEFYPAISNNGNLYFTSDANAAERKDDIFVSRWENGQYAKPEALGEAVNSEGYEFNAYISPDESLLVFSGYNRADGLGSGDLYVSRKNADGSWRKAENMGKAVNSSKMDYCPYIDMVTQTLYFTSKRSSVAPKAFTSAKAMLQEMNKYENGLSRLYQVSIANLLNVKE